MDWLLDVFATWLYGLKVIAITLAVIMFISGLDDFFIDVVYWVRRIKRKLSVYRRYPRMSYRELYKPDEKPLAIMVPAWNETGVIGNMAELAATTLDYENYHIFVGTYPNDPDTQRDVDEVCARFPNVHKVVCARPGPTSKADCLNNVLDAITQFERSANFAFAGFILHDAEDVISPMELRLFNYLVERKDLIQIPVYPFEREWTHFTSMTYIDEFSELHGKDVPVREALAGQVPSAGVGTCFSRRAVTALLADGNGIAFDVQSLTEDYDIGFRLKEKGMTEIFVRFPVVDEAKEREQRKFLQHARTSNMICVREYFPDTFSTAVRQKSRWIIGIVFQGDARVSQTLMARLASLLESHPYLATPAKVAILSKPLPLAEQRQWQSQLPGIADNCPAIVRLLGDMSPSYDAAAWNRLAKCYRDTLPGVALYAWLQAEQRQPSAWQHRAVAYQAYQVEDYATALAAWQKISLHDMSNDDLLAAANTAQAAGNGAARDRWLQQAEQRELGNNAQYWWLHARRYIPAQPELALNDLTRSINIAPSANSYVARATIYRQRHNVPAAVSDLRAALELEPNNSNTQAALGYALWDSGDIAQSREMLEQAHKGLPDDPALIRQLAYVNQRLDDMPATQHYARLVIDDIDNQA